MGGIITGYDGRGLLKKATSCLEFAYQLYILSFSGSGDTLGAITNHAVRFQAQELDTRRYDQLGSKSGQAGKNLTFWRLI